MATARQPAVAGTFYPGDPAALRTEVRALLAEAAPPLADSGAAPKALIAPHAGYVYSGPVAASAYRYLAPDRDAIRRIVLLGPAHTRAISGLAIPRDDAFETPLGRVPVDRDAGRAVASLPQVKVDGRAHAREHCLEVHLPFLQEVLRDFAIVPLVIGAARTSEVAEVIELLWGGTETRIVVSSDLSHYHDYETARRLDGETCAAIEGLRPDDVHSGGACGAEGIRGLLSVARRRGLRVRTVDLRNSGDTAGSRSSVVGYGAWAIG